MLFIFPGMIPGPFMARRFRPGADTMCVHVPLGSSSPRGWVWALAWASPSDTGTIGDGDGTTGAWGGETAPLFTTGTFISPAARVSGTTGTMDALTAILRRGTTTATSRCAAAEIRRSIGTTTLIGTITGTIIARTITFGIIRTSTGTITDRTIIISGSRPFTTGPTTRTGPITTRTALMSGPIIT